MPSSDEGRMSDTGDQAAQALPETTISQALVVVTHGIHSSDADSFIAEAVLAAVEHIDRPPSAQPLERSVLTAGPAALARVA